MTQFFRDLHLYAPPYRIMSMSMSTEREEVLAAWDSLKSSVHGPPRQLGKVLWVIMLSEDFSWVAARELSAMFFADGTGFVRAVMGWMQYIVLEGRVRNAKDISVGVMRLLYILQYFQGHAHDEKGYVNLGTLQVDVEWDKMVARRPLLKLPLSILFSVTLPFGPRTSSPLGLYTAEELGVLHKAAALYMDTFMGGEPMTHGDILSAGDLVSPASFLCLNGRAYGVNWEIISSLWMQIAQIYGVIPATDYATRNLLVGLLRTVANPHSLHSPCTREQKAYFLELIVPTRTFELSRWLDQTSQIVELLCEMHPDALVPWWSRLVRENMRKRHNPYSSTLRRQLSMAIDYFLRAAEREDASFAVKETAKDVKNFFSPLQTSRGEEHGFHWIRIKRSGGGGGAAGDC